MADDRTTLGGDPASSHVDDGFCLDLLAGLVPRESVRAAVEHMRTCRVCDERFRVMAADHESLRAGPMPRRSAAGEIVLVPPEPAGVADNNPKRARRGGPGIDFARGWRALLPRLAAPLAIGTAAVAVILMIHPWQGPAMPAGTAYWIPAGSKLLAQRSPDGASDLEALAEGIRAYEAHDLDKAIHSLGRARATGGADDLRRLYLASAFVLRGDGGRALDRLAPVDVDALPEPRRDEALWIRYVALVEMNRSREAAVLLDQLAGSVGPIGDLARRRKAITTPGASPGLP